MLHIILLPMRLSLYRPVQSVSVLLNLVVFIIQHLKVPNGKKVLIVENDGNAKQTFNIKFNGQWVTSTLPGGAVATFIW
jgi:glucosylceramidase